MRQNAFADGAPPIAPLGELKAPPQIPSWDLGEGGRGMEMARDGKGRKGKGKEEEVKGEGVNCVLID